MNSIQELNRKVASLESKVDLLETELSYLNALLIKCGFSSGIETLKLTVEEILSESSYLLEEDNEEIS